MSGKGERMNAEFLAVRDVFFWFIGACMGALAILGYMAN
jgi:hypothetical protein